MISAQVSCLTVFAPLIWVFHKSVGSPNGEDRSVGVSSLTISAPSDSKFLINQHWW